MSTKEEDIDVLRRQRYDVPKTEQKILLKHFPEGVIAFDLETTGLSPLVDRIVEISAVKVVKGKISYFESLVNPQITMSQVVIDIHGITDDMVADSPTIDTVMPKFREFCGNLPLIAHNAKFDLGFLVFDMHHLEMPLPTSPVYCSCIFSRYAFLKMPNYRLGTLAAELDIELTNHHRALADAFACLRVFALGLLHIENDGGRILNLKEAFLFNFDAFSKNRDFKIPKHLIGLSAKLVNQEIVDIKYTGGSVRNEFRPVRPISFLPMPGKNILYAHCCLSNHLKSFILKKIVAYKELTPKEIEARLEFLKKSLKK